MSVVSAHDKEKSWTERIKQRVDTVLESATSYTDFEKQLEERGISCEQKQFTDRKTGKTQDPRLSPVQLLGRGEGQGAENQEHHPG